MNVEPDDVRRDRIRAEIRAKRGTAERAAEIEALRAQTRRPAPGRDGPSDGQKTPENSTHFHNHPWPEWFAMQDAALAYIARCAARREMASYGQVWAEVGAALGKDIGNPFRQIPHLLEHLARRMHRELGVIATATVVHDDSGDDGPGPGFFRLAVDLGDLPESEYPPKGEDWSMSVEQRRFWDSQVQAMFDQFAG